MAYIEQTRGFQSIWEVIRGMFRAVEPATARRHSPKDSDAAKQSGLPLSAEARRDIGATVEYQDYASSRFVTRTSNRRLFDTVDAAHRWPHP